jgi:hypothetical protein
LIKLTSSPRRMNRIVLDSMDAMSMGQFPGAG